MYNYNFEKEKVIKEANNITLKLDNNFFISSILLTDKNLLIFFDANKDNALKGSGVQVLPEYFLLVKVPLKELNYILNNNETLINNNIIIYNFNLKEFLQN